MSRHQILVLIMVATSLSGCDDKWDSENTRNKPFQQVEDYAICKKGGMTPYSTMYGEIKCSPPQGSNT